MNPTLLPVVVRRVRRAPGKLSQKLLAFVASGALVVLVVTIAQIAGLTLDPVLVSIIGGTITTLAAYLRTDRLLTLPPTMIARKVVAFAFSGVSATALVALAPYIGLEATLTAPAAASLVGVLGVIAGYITTDETLVVDDTPGRHEAPAAD